MASVGYVFWGWVGSLHAVGINLYECVGVVMGYKSFDYECSKCLRRMLGMLVKDQFEKVECPFCGFSFMRILPMAPKSYRYGEGDNSASTTPERFRTKEGKNG